MLVDPNSSPFRDQSPLSLYWDRRPTEPSLVRPGTGSAIVTAGLVSVIPSLFHNTPSFAEQSPARSALSGAAADIIARSVDKLR